MAPILTCASDRRDHLEQPGAFPGGRLDQLRACDRRFHVATFRQVLRRNPPKICGGDLEEALLEPLPLPSGEPPEPGARLAPALDVARLQGVHIAPTAD